MKTPLFLLAAAGAVGLACAAPQAQAGGVHVDVYIGIPGVVHPHVIYRPMVVYHPHAVHRPHVHHWKRRDHGHRHSHRHFRRGHDYGYATIQRPRALGTIGPNSRLQ